MTGRKILAVAAALGLAALFLHQVVSAVQSVRRQARADRVCEATAERRWGDAVALSGDLDAASAAGSPEGRIATECRCWALLALGRDTECVTLVDTALAAEDDWLPEPALAKRVLKARLESGRAEEAAALARRVSRVHPDDADLLHFELRARSLTEGEEAVLRDFEARLESRSDASLSLRLVLAGLHKQRGDAEGMLRVLGEDPPAIPAVRLAPWFEARAQAWAKLGRADRVRETYQRWRALGGNEAMIDALYALQLSFGGLPAPDGSLIDLLEGALEQKTALRDPVMVEALYERLIAQLLVAGLTERALAVYDEASKSFDLDTITREQIANDANAAARRELASRHGAVARPEGTPELGAPGRLAFTLPSDAPRGTLFVSPGPEAPSDASYERRSLAPGETLRVERTPTATPVRWVFRDDQDRTRASGTTWPATGKEAHVTVEVRAPQQQDPRPSLDPAPADGRRRVFVLIPDCMDWRLVQYLRTRGELPLLDHLLETGYHAVLESDPPLTAAAMESLVWPTRSREITLLGLVHRVGIEIGGLASVGRNPLAFLDPFLPESAGLFETVGAGKHVAANMLFSHGAIDAGQNALLTGPHGRERSARSVRGVRPLRTEERARYPGFVETEERYRELVETTAAELDAAVEIAREDLVDLLLLRIEPLDLMTHGKYSELTRARQDDGESLLLDLYRYIDDRIAEVAAELDEDDILIVMSDHGIRTAMEHSKDAIFVAVGDGIPHGRAPGMPALHGVPRVLADLLAVNTHWPDTGVVPWLGDAGDNPEDEPHQTAHQARSRDSSAQARVGTAQ